jgi:hypothetical protein
MRQRDVPVQGFDLDDDNQTFSRTYPDWVKPLSLEAGPEAEAVIISKVLRRVRDQPVTLIDPQAHTKRVLMDALRRIRFLEETAQEGVRFTALLFPQDNRDVMDDISETVRTLKDSVDWVVIRNPAKTTGFRMYDGSALESILHEYGAATFNMPWLMADTINHLARIEKEAQRAIGPAEALVSQELKVDIFHRIILEDWMMEVFAGYDAIAEHLLPDCPALAGIQARRKSKSRKEVAEQPRYLLGMDINTANLD